MRGQNNMVFEEDEESEETKSNKRQQISSLKNQKEHQDIFTHIHKSQKSISFHSETNQFLPQSQESLDQQDQSINGDQPQSFINQDLQQNQEGSKSQNQTNHKYNQDLFFEAEDQKSDPNTTPASKHLLQDEEIIDTANHQINQKDSQMRNGILVSDNQVQDEEIGDDQINNQNQQGEKWYKKKSFQIGCIFLGACIAIIFIVMIALWQAKVILIENEGGQHIILLNSQELIKNETIIEDGVTYRMLPEKMPTNLKEFKSVFNDNTIVCFPIKMVQKEQVNYTAEVSVDFTQMVEGVEEKRKEVNSFDIEFYTLNITSKFYRVLIKFQEQNIPQDTSGSSDFDPDFFDDEDYETQDDQEEEQPEENPMKDGTIKVSVDYQTTTQNSGTQLRLSICDIQPTGFIMSCQFYHSMTDTEKIQTLTFLRQYLPHLKMNDYRNKRRILSKGPHGRYLAESNYDINFDEDKNQIDLGSDKQNDTSTEGAFNKATDNQVSSVDPELGKVSSSEQQTSNKISAKNVEGSQKSPLEKVDAKSSLSMKLIASAILDDEIFEGILVELQDTKTFNLTLVIDPESVLKSQSVKISPQEGQIESEGGTKRNLASSQNIVFDLTKQLFSINLLISKLKSSAGIICTDSYCDSGVKLSLDPFIQFWPVRYSFNANLGISLITYRYYQTIFHQYTSKLSGIIEQFQRTLSNELDNIFFKINDLTQYYLEPANHFEDSANFYLEGILNSSQAYNSDFERRSRVAYLKIDRYVHDELSNFEAYAIQKVQFTHQQISRQVSDILSTISGKSLSNSSRLEAIESCNQILDEFDKVRTSLNNEYEEVISALLLKPNLININISSIYEYSFIENIGVNEVLSSTITQILSQYLEPLLSPIKNSINVLKFNTKVKINLSHAKLRLALNQTFNNTLYNQSEGADILTTEEKSQLSKQSITSLISSQISRKFVIDETSIDIEELVSSLIQSFTTQYSALFRLLQRTATSVAPFFLDEKDYLIETISSMNATMQQNVTDEIANSLSNISKAFPKLGVDISDYTQSLNNLVDKNSNISVPSNLTGLVPADGKIQPPSVIIKDIKNLVAKINDLIDLIERQESNLKNLSASFSEIENKFSRFQSNFKNIQTTVKDIHSKLSNQLGDVSDIAMDVMGVSVKNSFNLIVNQQKTQLINNLKTYAIDSTKNVTSSYLTNLEMSLIQKLSDVIPEKKWNHNKEYSKPPITLFALFVPIGPTLLVISLQYGFFIGFNMECGIKKGEFYGIVSPYAYFSVFLQQEWIAWIYRLKTIQAIQLFRGTAIAKAALKFFSLTPSVTLTFDVIIEALVLVIAAYHRFLTIKFGWKCWGRRRCRICIPYIYFKWTGWKKIKYFEKVLGPKIQKNLLNIEKSFSIPGLM